MPKQDERWWYIFESFLLRERKDFDKQPQQYTQKMQHHKKKNEVMPFAALKMNIENIILNLNPKTNII